MIKTLLLAISWVLIVNSFLYSASLVWTGNGTNNRFNNAANWDKAVSPSAGDTVVFNETSSKSCELSANTAVLGMVYMTQDYTGSFSFGSRLLNCAGDINFNSGGEIIPGSGRIVFSGSSDVSLTIKTNTTIYRIEKNGGGKLSIEGSGLTLLNSLYLNGGSLFLGEELTHTTPNFVTTSGTSVDFGSSTLYVTAGNVAMNGVAVMPGTGKLVLSRQNGNQTLIPTASGQLPDVFIMMGNGRTATISTNRLVGKGVHVVSGSLSFGSGFTHEISDFTVSGSVNISTSTLKVSGSDIDLSSAVSIAYLSTGAIDFCAPEGTTQYFIPASGTASPRILKSGGGKLQLGGILLTTPNYLQTNGSLDLNGCNISVISGGSFSIVDGNSNSIENCDNRKITVAGSAILNGRNENELVFIMPTAQCTLEVSGSLSANYTRMSHCLSLLSTATARNSIDGGNNTNWFFGSGKAWGGMGSDNRFNNPLNWSGNSAPSSGDTVIFSSLSNMPCSLTANTPVLGKVVFTSGYTGMFSFGPRIVYCSGDIDMRSGGIISEGTGRISLSGSGTQFLVPQAGGTLYRIDKTGSGEATVIENSVNLSNLLYLTDGKLNLGNNLYHTVSSFSATTGILDFGSSSLEIKNGNISFGTASVTGGTGKLYLTRQDGNQTITPATSGSLPDIIIAMEDSRTTTITNNGLVAGNVTINSGTLNFGTALVHQIASLSGNGKINLSSSEIKLSGSIVDFGSFSTSQTTGGKLDFTGVFGVTQTFSPGISSFASIRHSGEGRLRLFGSDVATTSFQQTNGILDFNNRNISVVSGGTFSITGGRSYSIENIAGRKISVTGSATLIGTPGNLLSINPVAECTLAVTGSLSGDYLNLSNCRASVSTGITDRSVDGGNNTNWRFGPDCVWTGSGSDNLWSNPQNWSNNLLPQPSDTARFGALFTGECVLDADYQVRSIIFSSSATGRFRMNGHSLSISGLADMQTGGTIETEGGALVFNGTAPQQFIPGSGNPMPIIVQSGSGGTTVLSNGFSTTELRLNAGTFNLGSALSHTVSQISGNASLNFGTCSLKTDGSTLNFSTLGSITGSGTLVFSSGGHQSFMPKQSVLPVRIAIINGSTLTLESRLVSSNAVDIRNGVLGLEMNSHHQVGSITGSATGTMLFDACTLSVTGSSANFNSIGSITGKGVIRSAATSNQTITPKSALPVSALIVEGNSVSRSITIAGINLSADSLIIKNGRLTLGTTQLTHNVNAIRMSGGRINFGTATLLINGGLADFRSADSIIPATGTLTFLSGHNETHYLFGHPVYKLPKIEVAGNGRTTIASTPLNVSAISIDGGTLDFGNNSLQVLDGDFIVTNGLSSTFDNLSDASIYVKGNASFTGVSSSLLNLNPQSSWTINIDGTLDANNAIIANSISTGAPGNAVNCVDGGGNTNWLFVNGEKWTNLSGDGFWSNPQNWSNGRIPSGNDTVLFSGEANHNCILDVDAEVATIRFTSDYTAAFNFGQKSLTVYLDADFRTGGELLAESGILVLSPEGAAQLFPPDGKLMPYLTKRGSGTINIQSAALYSRSLAIESGTVDLGSGYTHNTGDVYGTGRLIFNNSTLSCNGDVDLSTLSELSAGTGTLILTGSGTRTFKPHPVATLFNLNIIGTQNVFVETNRLLVSGTLTMQGATVNIGGSLTHSIANVASISPVSTIISDGSVMELMGANIDFRQITYQAPNGSLIFPAGGAQTLRPRSTGVLPPVIIDKKASSILTIANYRLSTSSIQILAGTLNLGSNLNHICQTIACIAGINFGSSSRLSVNSSIADFSGATVMTAGTGILEFTGSATNQTLKLPPSGLVLPDIIHSGSGTLVLDGALLKARSLSQNSGSLDLNEANIELEGDFTITNGNSQSLLDLEGRTIYSAGNILFSGSVGGALSLSTTESWTVFAGGTLQAYNALIRNSIASGSQGQAFDCSNNGGNINWTFTNSLDSLKIMALNLIPQTVHGEGERDLPVLRMTMRHPTPTGRTFLIKKMTFNINTGSPERVISRKALRYASGDLITSSTTIETANPVVFDLSATPLYLSPSNSISIDFLIDITANPEMTSFGFVMPENSALSVIDSLTGDSVVVKYEEGFSLPFSPPDIMLEVNTAVVPSGKAADGGLSDWEPEAEEIGSTTSTGESFLCTWDNNNVYFAWKGRNIETDAVLFVAIDTGSTGSSKSWNYLDYGTHNFPSGFNGCDFMAYFANSSTSGFLDAHNGYSLLPFSGNISSGSNGVEIRIPKSDLGFARKIRIIPFIQAKGSGEILASMPREDVEEHLRNPKGLPSQNFISWYEIQIDTTGVTPKQASETNSTPPMPPTWSYDLGEGNFAAALTIGYQVVYVSIGGTNPGLASFRQSDGLLNWRYDLPSAPTSVTSYYESLTKKDILAFCINSTFYAAYDNISSLSIIGSYGLSSNGGAPVRSIPPDGNGYSTVYAYVPLADGTLLKINIKTLVPVWQTTDMSLSEKTNIVNSATVLYMAGTDGKMRTLDINGNLTGEVFVNASPVNHRISFSSTLSSIYAAPEGSTLFSLRSNLSYKWSYETGSPILAAPFVWPGTNPGYIFCPSGKQMVKLIDSASTPVYKWSYQTTADINVNPVALGNAVYFSSSDKRNFAIHKDLGTDMQGWPTAVFEGASNTRVVVDGSTNSVFFGAARKIYRYPKQ